MSATTKSHVGLDDIVSVTSSAEAAAARGDDDHHADETKYWIRQKGAIRCNPQS